MTERLNYKTAAPQGYQAFGRVHQYVAGCSVEPALIHLVYLRVSQINGCAYCVDLHSRDAIEAGVSVRKVCNVATWEESPYFSERERAALLWAESLTRLAETRAPDAAYQAVRGQFADRELADLSYAIALMNALNRLGVGFRMRPPADPAA